MSRRRIATALAASIVGASLVPIGLALAAGSSPACPSWTDEAGDSGPFALGGTPAASDSLDIVKTEVVNSATEVRAVVTLAGLGDTSTTPLNGESLELDFNLNGKASYFSAAREPNAPNLPNPGAPVNYDFTAAFIDVDGTSVDATATYNAAAKTISVVAKPADVSAALGAPVGSATFDTFDTLLFNATLGVGYPEYDSSTAPTTLKLTGQCTGSPVAVPSSTSSSTPSATPTATASPTPSATESASPTPSATESATPPPTGGTATLFDLPRVGCTLVTDGPGDAKPTVSGPVQDNNDPDLDLRGVTIRTTGDSLRAAIKLDKLGDTTSGENFGDKFTLEFKANGKTVSLSAGRKQEALFGPVPNPAAGQLPDPNSATVNGAAEPKLKFKPTFDTAKSYVIFDIDRAGLAAAVGAPVADGAELSALAAHTEALEPQRTLATDSAPDTAPSTATYVVGDNTCFLPPPAKMEWLGDDVVTAQYGDLVEGAVQLVADDDSALEGRTVTFTLGASTVSTVTDADGVADAFLPALAVGAGKIVAAFAGDADNSKTSLPYNVTVKPETSKLKLTVVKSGTKRTVTALLTDDDTPSAKVLSKQRLDVLVNGKKVGTVTTDAKGKAAWAKAVAGQTVKFSFAAVTGKYAATTAQLKLA